MGLTLPENLKLSALKRLNVDADEFRRTEIDRGQASSTLKDYITAIADELQDDPLVVAILDGKTLQMFLEDEDDFAMLAENLFTDLDTEDNGKISKNEIQNALVHMGVEMGIPPFSECPLLYDILKKHRADGEGDLGQAQFAQVLQLVLQELAEILAENHVVVIQNIKISTGSKIRKLLADEKRLNDLAEKILHENGQKGIETIRVFLEKTGKELGLPPLKGEDGTGVLLYDVVFADVMKGNNATVSDNEELKILLVAILDKFAEQLETSPIFYELDS